MEHRGGGEDDASFFWRSVGTGPRGRVKQTIQRTLFDASWRDMRLAHPGSDGCPAGFQNACSSFVIVLLAAHTPRLFSF